MSRNIGEAITKMRKKDARYNKTESGSKIEQEGKNKPWQCLKCGKCCKFIVIPVMDPVDMETEEYLEAHGILTVPPPLPSPNGGGRKGEGVTKLLIPAVCKYLDVQNGTPVIYRCKIHADKFVNCRLGGEKECKEAQKAWSLLNPKC